MKLKNWKNKIVYWIKETKKQKDCFIDFIFYKKSSLKAFFFKEPKIINVSSDFSKIFDIIKNDKHEFDPIYPAIEVKKYTKRFKNFLSANEVSFVVKNGTIHGFVGPNGSGKTTVIKALIGAYLPTSGKIYINGKKAATQKANSLIGYIPERASFPKHLNCLQYLKTMAEYSGFKSREAKTRAIAILKALNLYEHANRKPLTFSSGMQKKILLAQALLTDPWILIFDEPAANLDPTSRQELFDQLVKLRNQGKTIFISTHILSELEKIIDDVTFIYYGEIIYNGSVQKLNNEMGSVFINSSNNKKLIKCLKEANYKIGFENGNEIEVLNIAQKNIGEVFKFLSDSKIKIISFRTNDLQTIYNKFLFEAKLKQKGKQTLSGIKINL